MKIEKIKTVIKLTHEDLLTAIKTVYPNIKQTDKVYNFENGLIFEIVSTPDGNNALDGVVGSCIVPSVVNPLHNPNNLTNSIIGTRHGYRLLNHDEILRDREAPEIFDLHMYEDGSWCKCACGVDHEITYRTKLSVEELKKARGL